MSRKYLLTAIAFALAISSTPVLAGGPQLTCVAKSVAHDVAAKVARGEDITGYVATGQCQTDFFTDEEIKLIGAPELTAVDGRLTRVQQFIFRRMFATTGDGYASLRPIQARFLIEIASGEDT